MKRVSPERITFCGTGLILALCPGCESGTGQTPVTPTNPTPGTPVGPARAPRIEGVVATGATANSMSRIAGAKIEVVDGPEAGTSTLSDEKGEFFLPPLSTSNISLMATREGFEPETVRFVMTPPQQDWWESIALVPSGTVTSQPITLGVTVTSVVTDAPCSTGSTWGSEGPMFGMCKQFKLTTSQSGTLVAQLLWNNRAIFFTFVASGPATVTGGFSPLTLRVPVQAGSVEQLEVRIHGGEPPAPFTLTTSLVPDGP